MRDGARLAAQRNVLAVAGRLVEFEQIAGFDSLDDEIVVGERLVDQQVIYAHRFGQLSATSSPAAPRATTLFNKPPASR